MVDRYGAGEPGPNVVDADSFSSTITNTWPIGGSAALGRRGACQRGHRERDHAGRHRAAAGDGASQRHARAARRPRGAPVARDGLAALRHELLQPRAVRAPPRVAELSLRAARATCAPRRSGSPRPCTAWRRRPSAGRWCRSRTGGCRPPPRGTRTRSAGRTQPACRRCGRSPDTAARSPAAGSAAASISTGPGVVSNVPPHSPASLARIRSGAVAVSSAPASADTLTVIASGLARRATGAIVIASRTGLKLSAPASAAHSRARAGERGKGTPPSRRCRSAANGPSRHA